MVLIQEWSLTEVLGYYHVITNITVHKLLSTSLCGEEICLLGIFCLTWDSVICPQGGSPVVYPHRTLPADLYMNHRIVMMMNKHRTNLTKSDPEANTLLQTVAVTYSGLLHILEATQNIYQQLRPKSSQPGECHWE